MHCLSCCRILTHSSSVCLKDNQSYVKYFNEFRTADGDIVRFLNRTIQTKDLTFSKLNQGVAVRILSAILSDFDTVERNYDASLSLVKLLINDSMKGSTKVISDYIILVCFSHLLLVPKIINSFLHLDGLTALRSILEANSKDLQVTYYIFICYWILSFDEAFRKYAADPKVLSQEPHYRTDFRRAQTHLPREAHPSRSQSVQEPLRLSRVHFTHD